jgi:hypothetical protein
MKDLIMSHRVPQRTILLEGYAGWVYGLHITARRQRICGIFENACDVHRDRADAGAQSSDSLDGMGKQPGRLFTEGHSIGLQFQ